MLTPEQFERMMNVLSELTMQTGRLARVLEKEATTEPDVVASFRRLPAINYMNSDRVRDNNRDRDRDRNRDHDRDNDPNTISPPRMPRNLSWHEKVREKRVSLPVATIGSAVGVLVIELGRLLAEGKFHFP